MIKCVQIFFTLALAISSCSSLDAIKQNYNNLLPNPQIKTYIVKPGDSVWSIALELNMDANAIILNNDLKKPYVIYPNQELFFFRKKNNLNVINDDSIKQWQSPLKGIQKPEQGNSQWLEYKEPKGKSIHSVYDGIVVVSGPDIPGYGNLVMISHPDGYLSLYAHCDQVYVSQGDQVLKGTLIANLGNSEAAYPMLRFQLRKNGKPVQASKINF